MNAKIDKSLTACSPLARIPKKRLLFSLVLFSCGVLLSQVLTLGGAVRSGFNSSVMTRNDDDSVGPINLGFTISIFGNSVSQIYINNNGNITFDGPLGTYTPQALSTTQATLSPFWADVDTRSLSSSAVTFGSGTVNGKSAFGVNWINVGYYDSHADKLNQFQLVIVYNGSSSSFDVEFNYDSITWETGDVSGGSNGFGGYSARAGLTDGAGWWYELEGSGVNGAFLNTSSPTGLINHSLNSGGVAGRYVFSWSSGVFQPPTIRYSTWFGYPPTGWTAHPFLNGGGSQNVYSTASAINTTGLQNPAPQAVYQHLQEEFGTMTWTARFLQPGATYKVRVHLSSVQIPFYASVFERVAATDTTGTYYVDLTPYGSGGFNQATIVELPHNFVPDSSNQISGTIAPTGWGTYAVVSGVEVIKNP
jgi:hypothetical protein